MQMGNVPFCDSSGPTHVSLHPQNHLHTHRSPCTLTTFSRSHTFVLVPTEQLQTHTCPCAHTTSSRPSQPLPDPHLSPHNLLQIHTHPFSRPRDVPIPTEPSPDPHVCPCPHTILSRPTQTPLLPHNLLQTLTHPLKILSIPTHVSLHPHNLLQLHMSLCPLNPLQTPHGPTISISITISRPIHVPVPSQASLDPNMSSQNALQTHIFVLVPTEPSPAPHSCPCPHSLRDTASVPPAAGSPQRGVPAPQ